MKIKQVCELTSLTDRAIRYYIEEGLAAPAYTENYMGRRAYDFTEEDVTALNHVATLRKFGFTVEEIRRILTDPQESIAVLAEVRARKEETLRQESDNLDALARLEAEKAYTVAELAERLEEPVREVEVPKEDRWKIGSIWVVGLVCNVLLLIVIAVMVIGFALPIFLISESDEILNEELRNPYIDDGYSGWNVVRIQGIGSFRMPSNWRLQQQNDFVTIYDDNEKQIAVGFVYPSENGIWSTMTDQELRASMAAHAGFMPLSVEYLPVTDFLSFDGCELFQIVFRDEKSAVDYYCLELRTSESDELWLLFPAKGNLYYNDMIDITQAIAYSYVYPK